MAVIKARVGLSFSRMIFINSISLFVIKKSPSLLTISRTSVLLIAYIFLKKLSIYFDTFLQLPLRFFRWENCKLFKSKKQCSNLNFRYPNLFFS